MLRILCFAFLCCLSGSLGAQKLCTGKVRDSLSGEPLEFVNIGIPGKSAGSVTNEKGEFSFIVPDSLASEPVKVSIIGYKPFTFYFKPGNQHNIVLQQHAQTLGEITVKANKTKITVLGNATTTKKVTAGFKRNALGSEIAVKLKIKSPDTQIRRFFLNIVQNPIHDPVFRLNVYAVSPSGAPGENLLKQNVIIEPGAKEGLISVDLSGYNIFVSDDVFISVEWIKDLGDASKLTFSTKLFGSTTYFRNASQGKWEKLESAGVGLHAEVAY